MTVNNYLRIFLPGIPPAPPAHNFLARPGQLSPDFFRFAPDCAPDCATGLLLGQLQLLDFLRWIAGPWFSVLGDPYVWNIRTMQGAVKG